MDKPKGVIRSQEKFEDTQGVIRNKEKFEVTQGVNFCLLLITP